MSLSILCVTKAESFAQQFLVSFSRAAEYLGAQLVLAADGAAAFDKLSTCKFLKANLFQVNSSGYIESVLDEAVEECESDYILRLDDDESISPAMLQWLAASNYLSHDNWKFPRIHLWPNLTSALMTPHLFPDHQTRLAVKAKSGGRRMVHDGSPHGGGELAPVAIFHHKFLVKSYDERRRIAESYDRVVPGYGTGGMLPFSLPEDAYDEVTVVASGDGHVPWDPAWSRTNVAMKAKA